MASHIDFCGEDEGERGFFLIEAVALAFIIFAASFSFVLFSALTRQREDASALVTAAFIAEEQIAYAEAQPKSYLSSVDTLPWLGDGAEPIKLNGREFHVSTAVRPAEGGLRSVEVTLSWQERGKTKEKMYRRLVDCHE